MTGTGDTWVVDAVRFAVATNLRSEHFLRFGASGLPDGPLDCDFYFWVLRRGDEAWLFDSGFSPEVGQLKGKHVFAGFVDCLAELGLIPSDINVVVYSHLHYDHTGHLDLLPGARIVVQKAELDFWTSEIGGRKLFADITHPPDLDRLRKARFDDRITTVEGDVELTPGINTVLLAGHTAGQQGVRIRTAESEVVLASDAAHFYDELTYDLPFAIVDHLGGMYASFDRLRCMGTAGAVVVPGHDPDVKERFERRELPFGGHVVNLR